VVAGLLHDPGWGGGLKEKALQLVRGWIISQKKKGE